MTSSDNAAAAHWLRRARRPAVWLAPVAGAVAAISLAAMTGRPDRGTLNAWAFAVSATTLFAPLFAGAAAWESARLARGGLTMLPAVRSRVAILLRLGGPLLAGAVLAVAALCVLFAGWPTVPAAQVASWLGLSVSAVAVLAAAVVLGMGFGFRMRQIVAAPVALLATYLWVAVPAGISSPLWPRHLVGVFDTCCEPAVVISPHAMVGAAIVTLGIAGAGLLLTAGHAWWRSAVAAVAVLALCVAVGANLVRTLEYRPEIPRAGEMTCQTAAGLTICAWPEHAGLLDEAIPIVVSAAEAMRAADLPLPNTITEQRDVPDGVTIALSADDLRSGGTGVRRALAMSAHPGWDVPECAAHGPWPSGMLVRYLDIWLAGIVGVDISATADEQAAIARIRQRPIDAQRAWFDGVAAALKTCEDPAPDLLP
mgnify:FL=1